MATTLGTKAVESIVKLKENGAWVNYIVAHQGLPSSAYDNSCNGTWLLRQTCPDERRVWDSGDSNVLETSDIHNYLNNTWINRYDEDIRNIIKQVRIPYRRNGGESGTNQTGANGLLCKVFILSLNELGIYSEDYYSHSADNGDKLNYFIKGTGDDASARRRAGTDETPSSNVRYWTRSQLLQDDINVWEINDSQYQTGGPSSQDKYIRPVLILPTSTLVLDDGSVTTNKAPTMPPSISVPDSISGGSTITISWGASSDAEGNLEGYIVERSTNGGSSWNQIYQGGALSTTNTVAFGTQSVIYRVKAYDSEGLSSGSRTSNQVTVINNTAPTAPGSITVPQTVVGGGSLSITWTAGTDAQSNLTGYVLERKVGSGSWSQVYKGSGLSYQDTITKGWETVQYRVKAYDAYNAESGYTTSAVRTVDNNTNPTFSCNSPSGSNLGTKNAGFTVSYSVDDAENDTVSVTESMDGVTKRTFNATLESENQFQVTGAYFQQLLNGQHTMKMKATDDGGKSAEYTLLFTKLVTACSVTLADPMDADAQITIAALSVSGDIPADANFQVLLTNNANDTSPTWEDATQEVKNGSNYLFENQSASNGYAFNFKVIVSRGSSGTGGYISSIQGGFQ